MESLEETTMETIVKYTDRQPPKNRYPAFIISPPRSGPCCFSDMEEIGSPQTNKRWVFQYKRCKHCGFTVRVILREVADDTLAAELRQTLATCFTRNSPDY
jgi:hypothetical protein